MRFGALFVYIEAVFALPPAGCPGCGHAHGHAHGVASGPRPADIVMQPLPVPGAGGAAVAPADGHAHAHVHGGAPAAVPAGGVAAAAAPAAVVCTGAGCSGHGHAQAPAAAPVAPVAPAAAEFPAPNAPAAACTGAGCSGHAHAHAPAVAPPVVPAGSAPEANPAASGGSAINKITLATTATASTPFMLAFIDEARNRTMEFIHPARDEVLFTGKTYTAQTRNFGIASRLHLRTAELFLLNDKLEQVLPYPVGTIREDLFIKNLRRWWDQPQDSEGEMEWSVPDTLESGRYRLKYQSSWTWWKGMAAFTAISPPFQISNDVDFAPK